MITITDKYNRVVAYIHNKIILGIDRRQVIGLILGNCVFGRNATAVGKFLNNTFRTIDGLIAGKAVERPELHEIIEPETMMEIMNASWQLLSLVKDHNCTWVEEKNTWTNIHFDEFLLEGKTQPAHMHDVSLV